jgi:predicted metal-dependent phosphoesterase TrpH
MEDVEAQAQGGAVGRPHVARALLQQGHARDVQDAFDRWLGWGKPGFVEKRLPTFAEVAALVHRAGGVMSAAHLKDRGSRGLLTQLKGQGLDAVEIRHPTHDDDTRRRLTNLARELSLLPSGGSDWHGDDPGLQPGGRLGAQEVPAAWLQALDRARPALREPGVAVRT